MSYNPSSGAVTSVFGRLGAIVKQVGDYLVGDVTGAAPLASPALTGNPTAPTQAALDDSTKIATTKYADDAVAVLAATLGLQIKVATLALTDAQIKAFGGGGALTVVAAPGAGIINIPVLAVIKIDATAGAYTNISAASDIEIDWAVGGIAMTAISQAVNSGITALLGTASVNVGILTTYVKQGAVSTVGTGKFGVLANLANQALQVAGFNTAGAYTGGAPANSGKVTLYYAQVTP